MAEARVALSDALGDDALGQVGDVLRRSFGVESIRQEAGDLVVRVRDDVSAAELRRTVKQAMRAQRYASDDCVFSRQVSGPTTTDPQPALEARGDVQRLGPGLFAFRGDFLRVRTGLDTAVRAMAARRGAVELSYPPLWPVSVLRSIDYFHDFPQLALLATGVSPHYEARAVFAERFRKGTDAPVIACTAENGVAPAAHALAPTVCDCCYWLLRERRDIADQVSTIHGQVFRNEASPDDRIDRLTAYTMREIVTIGSEAFVLAEREALMDEMATLMTRLDLGCAIKAADDPFFSNDALQKNAYQNLARLKYEVEVPLFGGRRTAVASINLHNDFFSRNYDYQDAAGARPFSACVGFGYERLTYALFCRHGVSCAEWPAAVRATLELD